MQDGTRARTPISILIIAGVIVAFFVIQHYSNKAGKERADQFMRDEMAKSEARTAKLKADLAAEELKSK